MSICAVIMAGGSGTRLWPLSRASYPKQFLPIFGDKTMLQESIKRLDNLNINSYITICNVDHRFIVAEQLNEIGYLGTIILEPVGKNTAPAIGLAATHKIDEDPLLLVLSADHIIKNTEAFERSIKNAIPIAESGKLVTFGIVPNKPNPQYGYIKKGNKTESGFVVENFIEKPSIDNAEDYLKTDEYLWNSGIFLFRASKYLEELKKYRPDIFKCCSSSVFDKNDDLDFLRIKEKSFRECPSESIDYAVMEKTKDAVVVPMDADWNDVGTWSSLWDISTKDSRGNSTIGDVLLHEVTNSYIRSQEKLVSVIGLSDLVIVDTKDALMVARKDHDQDIKIIIDELKNQSLDQWYSQREVHRPWGKFDCIDKGENFLVKRLTVKPGEKLSVQMHHHRSEHWIVVSGVAKVTRGEENFLLYENESTFIPAGVVHSLENPEKYELELIEVQSGNYLDENDIVRLDDKYGR